MRRKYVEIVIITTIESYIIIVILVVILLWSLIPQILDANLNN